MSSGWTSIDEKGLSTTIIKNENADDAAYRVLEERTGLKGVFLKQFKTYGNANRAKGQVANFRHLLQKQQVGTAGIKWVLDRFVSVAYYALTEYSKVMLKNNFSSSGVSGVLG